MSTTAAGNTVKGTDRQIFHQENIALWDEYVRKDTFDAHMQRMETLMERNLIEQRAMNERLEGKIEGVKNELKGDIKALDAKAHALEGKIDGVRNELKAMNERLEEKIDGVRNELEGKIDGVKNELKGDIKALDAKVYALEGKLSQNLVLTSIITTIFGIIITLVVAAIQFWK